MTTRDGCRGASTQIGHLAIVRRNCVAYERAMLERTKWALLNTWHALFLAVWSMFWMSLAVFATFVLRKPHLSLEWGRRFWSPGLFWACGVKVEIAGLENIDTSKPCIFVVNHQSMIDIPAVFVSLPMNFNFITKKELLAVPFLGQYIRASGMIPVDRRNGPEAVETLKKSAAMVRNGRPVVAFAEGTRSRTGVIAPFKKGAFILALEAQVPVVPLAIEGARAVLPSDGFAVRPGVIHIKVGAPIPTVGKGAADRDALMAEAREAVIKLNLELGGRGGESVMVELGAPSGSRVGAVAAAK